MPSTKQRPADQPVIHPDRPAHEAAHEDAVDPGFDLIGEYLREDIDRPPWWPQPGESAAAYSNFWAFIRLPMHRRSVRLAAEELGKSEKTLEKQCAAHSWVKRAMARDVAAGELALREESAEYRRASERLLQEAEQVRNMARLALHDQFEWQDDKPVAAKPGVRVGDALRLLKWYEELVRGSVHELDEHRRLAFIERVLRAYWGRLDAALPRLWPARLAEHNDELRSRRLLLFALFGERAREELDLVLEDVRQGHID